MSGMLRRQVMAGGGSPEPDSSSGPAPPDESSLQTPGVLEDLHTGRRPCDGSRNPRGVGWVVDGRCEPWSGESTHSTVGDAAAWISKRRGLTDDLNSRIPPNEHPHLWEIRPYPEMAAWQVQVR